MFNNLEAKIEVIPLNEQYDRMKQEVDNKVDNHKSGLSLIKSLAQIKLRSKTRKNNVFVIDFKGDKYASQSNCLAKEVSAILGSANKDDKVIVRLHSRGGTVTGYGRATSELMRLKDKDLHLTVCVDEIAASGGYMMAAVADRIIATPFACIGSIGVVFEMPNFSSFFDKVGVKYLQFTAGKHKRTVSMGMPVDDEGVEKMQEDIDLMHSLFKSHIKENRNTTNIDEVSEGQIWSGIVALEKDLVDELDCSENVILKACNESNVFEIRWEEPKSLMNKLSLAAESCIINVINRLPINSRFLA